MVQYDPSSHARARDAYKMSVRENESGDNDDYHGDSNEQVV